MFRSGAEVNIQFPNDSVVKHLPYNAVLDAGSFSGSGRSSGKGNGNPFQYSCLGIPMDRGAWWGTVLGVTKQSDTTQRLKNYNNNILPQFPLLLEEYHMFLFLNIWYILLTVINIVPTSQLDIIVKLNQYQPFWLKQEDQYYMIIFYHFSMRLDISFTTNKE